MSKYYFRDDEDEHCYTQDQILDYMKRNEISEMIIYEAKLETKSDFFFCKHFQEVGEKSENDCGKKCLEYKPRNGKFGICKNTGGIYIGTQKTLTLKLEVCGT